MDQHPPKFQRDTKISLRFSSESARGVSSRADRSPREAIENSHAMMFRLWVWYAHYAAVNFCIVKPSCALFDPN